MKKEAEKTLGMKKVPKEFRVSMIIGIVYDNYPKEKIIIIMKVMMVKEIV